MRKTSIKVLGHDFALEYDMDIEMWVTSQSPIQGATAEALTLPNIHKKLVDIILDLTETEERAALEEEEKVVNSNYMISVELGVKGDEYLWEWQEGASSPEGLLEKLREIVKDVEKDLEWQKGKDEAG